MLQISVADGLLAGDGKTEPMICIQPRASAGTGSRVDPLMAHENKVMRSINSDDGTLCVDLFQRPDGTFGFEEYRRDAEDTRGWYAVGHHGQAVFATQDRAFEAARTAVVWLAGTRT